MSGNRVSGMVVDQSRTSAPWAAQGIPETTGQGERSLADRITRISVNLNILVVPHKLF
jgi:hypothetical protein